MRHHIKSQMRSRSTNVVAVAARSGFAEEPDVCTNFTVLPIGFAACRTVAFNYNKRDDFFILARFRVLIPAAVST